MADGEGKIQARTLSAISEIDPAIWDALARDRDGRLNPFIRHAFLEALETSGSATVESGWAPRHLWLEDMQGGAIGAAPMYLKSHSMGEYVFDYAWADAYERAGGRYYPKLQIAAPFTPAPGPRLLAGGDPAREKLVGAAAAQLAAQFGVSSLHVTFATADQAALLEEVGFLRRRDQQFHWENRDYQSFEAFLDALASRKRKAIRRERKAVSEAGVAIDWIRGSDIREAHWDRFWEFYQDTGARKWGQPYLTRAFFSELTERMADNILLMFAHRDGRAIAGALNIIGDDTLYGRYWGCTEFVPFLHFELCYYQAIDFAIAEKLQRVEAGAQGEHKMARGYEPTPTHSAHWIADPGFRDAIAAYLAQETEQVDAQIDILGQFAPFKKTD